MNQIYVVIVVAIWLTGVVLPGPARAQNSSLLHGGGQGDGQAKSIQVLPAPDGSRAGNFPRVTAGRSPLGTAEANTPAAMGEVLPRNTPPRNTSSGSGDFRDASSGGARPTGIMPEVVPPPGTVYSPSGINLPRGDVSPLRGVSWTYQPAPPLRSFRIQDLVTIRVDEVARMMAEGESDKRRLSLYQAALADWIRISQGKLVPDPQLEGDPTVNAQALNNSRNQASIESREMMTFNIAARIVDIRPNGNLVLEARKQFWVNDNLWETSLSGICRPQDIAPDNVVLSRDLVDLEIRKQDQGHLRDGYRRTWLQRFLDGVKPF